jgi:formylglycine-generating enzyme required for sulfatase activity/WD40 repeat protein
MAWPLSQDYNEAIQNPLTSFSDAELRGGDAVTNALGMPMPRSGNFADVYEFHGASGQKWAVKCFTRQIPGLQERYSEISKHLVQAKLPFTVDFTYLEKGMRIRGEYYPVLKMQWVEGFLLNEFVRDNLDKPARLDALGQIWLRMAKRLHEANFAHADLQHGNVILVQGSKASSLAVKLIDYDGMWVPALKQKKSGELGHPAYQHPHRLQQAIYSAEVDRLPILAIACALRSLAVGGKTLWNKYDNGDNMLFRESDLRTPKASALLKELWNLSDPAAHDLAGYLAIALSGGLDKVPLLPELYSDNQPRALTAAQETQVAALLGLGAKVDRSAPPSKVTAVSARPKTSLATKESAPDWDFSSEPAPSSIVRRKAKSGINPLVMWGGAAAAGLLVLIGGVVLLLPKAQPPVAEIANNDFTPPDVPLKRPELTPIEIEQKKPEKAPIAPPEPMPIAEVVAREIPPQPPPPDYRGLAKNLELDLGNVKLKTVRIDPGKFMMGSPSDEKGRAGNEGPVHEVEITKPFYMGAHEVTRGQFRAFVNATGYKTDAESDGKGGEGFDVALNRYAGGYKSIYSWQFVGYDQTDEHPVVNVSWNDAMAFCAWLSQKEGKSVDLPTEAEWEYCCRAGSQARFQSGDGELSTQGFANVRDRSLQKVLRDINDVFDIDDGFPFTAPVGQFKPNAWELYDMVGNVFEWCKDWADANYYKSSPYADPSGPAQGKSRIARGASFNTLPNVSRVAHRRSHSPTSRSFAGGFRVVVRLGPPAPPPDFSKLAKNLELDLGNAKLKTVRIDPGKFMMGSPDDEVGRNKDEGPLHEVVITSPFYMGIHEVTRGQFRAFVNATGYKTEGEVDGKGGRGFNRADNRLEGAKFFPEFTWQSVGYPQTDEHPVVNVSWNDAMAFCAWLGRQTGKTVDLPTEAEWEYCCRAGTSTRYFSGDDEASVQGHDNVADVRLKKVFAAVKENFDFEDGFVFTAPVGKFQANAWNLHDMHGNVSEWCKDWIGPKYYTVSPGQGPFNDSPATYRAFRGGSFITAPFATRSAFRAGGGPSMRYYAVGFRVVVRLGPPAAERKNTAVTANANSSGFVPIFNGKDLTGFEGDLSRWSVRDGILTGSTMNNPPPNALNTFLLWTGRVDDFELKCQYRLEGKTSNTGIQYRSKRVTAKNDYLVSGYQADIIVGYKLTGSLWETNGRNTLAAVGQKIVLNEAGRSLTGTLGDYDSLIGADFDPAQWHEFRIVARGNHLQHFVDGKQIIDVLDNHETARALEGILALELSPNTTVHFKDIQLKRLSPSGVLAFERPPVPATADWRKTIIKLGPSGAQEYPEYVRINPNSWISTKEPYAGPIEITVIARTENQNIRLHAFNGACVIFNWELKPKELRVNRPDGTSKFESGSLAKNAFTPLLPNTWYKIQWRITEQGMTIKVDEKIVFTEKKNYVLSAANPVSVRAMKDPVDVKFLAVERLPTKGSSQGEKTSPAPTGTISEIRQFVGHDSDVYAVAFTPDGRFIYSGGEKTVRRWDVDTGTEVQNLESKFKVFSIAVAPDGKKLAAGGGGMVTIWDMVQKNATARGQPNDQAPIPVLFLPPGKKLITGSLKNGVGIWDVAKFDVSVLLEKTNNRVMSLAVTTDGKLLAFGGYGGEVHIRNIAGPTPISVANIGISAALIEALAFSPDGKTLAVGFSQNGKWALPGLVQFWSTKDGKQVGGFLAHEGGMVRSLAYSKDGKTLITASYDKTIKLWDMKNDKATLKATLAGHEGPIWSIALSPDGRYLASGSRDKTVRLWRLADADGAAKKTANVK